MTAGAQAQVDLLMRPPRLVDEVANRLRDLIIDGTLPAGTPLRQVALAEQLGVSRTPLREAIRVLENEGLLKAGKNRTVEVVPPTAADLLDMYQVREVVDGLAARLAAGHGFTEADDERAHHLLAEMAESSDPYDAVRRNRSHTEFHVLIARASRNTKVQSFASLIRTSSTVLYVPLIRESARANLVAADPSKSYKQILEEAQIQHRAIVDAIVARDPEAAEIAARRHIQRTLRLAPHFG